MGAALRGIEPYECLNGDTISTMNSSDIIARSTMRGYPPRPRRNFSIDARARQRGHAWEDDGSGAIARGGGGPGARTRCTCQELVQHLPVLACKWVRARGALVHPCSAL